MRLYRLLLRLLFPASFRTEYGDEMCAVFARKRRDHGKAAWFAAAIDLVGSAVPIHVDLLRQDLRWVFRGFQRSPGFTITAVTVAALGMGATTASFTLFNHVLIRPLPFPRAGELMVLYQSEFERGTARTQVTPPNYDDWKATNRTFASMGAYVPAQIAVNLSGQGEPVRLDAILAEPAMFDTLQVRPGFGRIFTSDEERTGNVVLLSHQMAAALFSDAAAAVGRDVRLNLLPYTVVGVMPADFLFPNRETDVWMPLRRSIGEGAWADRRNHILNVVGRLGPGMSRTRAVADFQAVTAQLAAAHPAENAGVSAEIVGLRDVISAQSRLLIIGVFAAAFCLTLIACTNLANLMFARTAARRQELAVRLAIGAGGDRLARQLLTECVVLALMGAVFGLALAAASRPLMLLLVPASLPTAAVPDLDWRVFAFAAVLALATSVAFGVGPALRSARTDAFQALRSRVIFGGRDRLRLGLVVAEVAATTVLLVATGLLLKAMWRVQGVDPGFDPRGVLTMKTTLPTTTPAAVRREFYARVLTESRGLPGVMSAGYVSFLPMTFPAGNLVVTVPGLTTREEIRAHTRFVTPDYFRTMSVPILRGRDVSDRDSASAPKVAVISQSLADRLWPRQDPLGQEFALARVSWTVVGVVGDVAVRGLEEPSLPQAYFPSDQMPVTIGGIYAPNDFVLRAAVDPMTLAPALRDIVRRANADQALSEVRLVEDIVAAQTSSRRAQLAVLTAFAAIAFALAAIGIYGLLSFVVATRTREIGVRLALGAARRDVVGMFVGQGLTLGAAGIAIGVPLSYAASRAMTALLFGVQPHDPWTYAGATALAVVMTLTGSIRPAVRAAGLDPAVTIRGE